MGEKVVINEVGIRDGLQIQPKFVDTEGKLELCRALVDAGGDMAIGDPPPGRQGWRITIEPLGTGPAAAGSKKGGRVVLLSRVGVAASGDAYQHIDIGDVRYSHILDPRTGLGLTTAIRVTVIARDGTTADALASALSVLGPRRGLSLIEATPGAAAIIEVGDRQGPTRSIESPRFAALAVAADGAVETPATGEAEKKGRAID